jgi:hypothetical protein
MPSASPRVEKKSNWVPQVRHVTFFFPEKNAIAIRTVLLMNYF